MSLVSFRFELEPNCPSPLAATLRLSANWRGKKPEDIHRNLHFPQRSTTTKYPRGGIRKGDGAMWGEEEACSSFRAQPSLLSRSRTRITPVFLSWAYRTRPGWGWFFKQPTNLQFLSSNCCKYDEISTNNSFYKCSGILQAFTPDKYLEFPPDFPEKFR